MPCRKRNLVTFTGLDHPWSWVLDLQIKKTVWPDMGGRSISLYVHICNLFTWKRVSVTHNVSGLGLLFFNIMFLVTWFALSPTCSEGSSTIYLRWCPHIWKGAWTYNIMFQFSKPLWGSSLEVWFDSGAHHLGTCGWRLPPGLATVPATLEAVGEFFCLKTQQLMWKQPKWEREKVLAGKAVELQMLVQGLKTCCKVGLANAIKHPFRNILQQRNKPQLVMEIFMPTFLILTGIMLLYFVIHCCFKGRMVEMILSIC